jgi:hypothetical protein
MHRDCCDQSAFWRSSEKTDPPSSKASIPTQRSAPTFAGTKAPSWVLRNASSSTKERQPLSFGQSWTAHGGRRSGNGIIEFVPQIGDFVAVDEPLFNLFGGAQSIDESTLRAAVAFGSERTIDQDPTFAFRIAADIALRALSPAINDPTTVPPLPGLVP